MLIRGTTEHTPAIYEMVTDFFNASPYQSLGLDSTRIHELVDSFVSADPHEKITILWLDNDKPVGVLAAAAEKNLFNHSRIACEVVWWLKPEYRRGRVAVKMLDAYEYWATRVGCQSAIVVDLLGNLDTFYKRRGYERRETSYLKVL
jgi:GNAT superfamily N-acetyltransferase